MATPASAESGQPLALVPDSGRGQRRAVGFDAATLWRITRMAFHYRWRMGLGILATAFAAGAQIVIPQLIGDAVDSAHGMLTNADVDAAGTRVKVAWNWLVDSIQA